MKTKFLVFSILFILTLWAKTSYGQCDAEFTLAPLNFCTEFDTMHVVNNSVGTGLTYLWEFDGQTFTDFEPNIVGYDDGIYWIYLTVTNGSCTNTDSIKVNIYGTPTCDLGNDTTICDGNAIQLFGGVGSGFYWNGVWSENSTHLVSLPGTYTLQLDDGRCVNYDTITVFEGTSPDPIHLGNDTTLCVGETTILDANPANVYIWNTGANTQTIEVNQAGTYNVITYNDSLGDCSSSDEIVITYDATNPPDLGDDIETCGDTILFVPNPESFISKLWSTGETTDTINVSTSNQYSIETINMNNCPGWDTIQVACNLHPETNLANDTTVVEGTTIALTPNSIFGVEPISDASGIEFNKTTKNVDVTNDFTLGIIVNPSAESFNYYGGLISRGNGSQVNQMDFIWFLKPDHTFELQLRNGTDSVIITSTSTLEIGVDYVLSATISSTNGIKLYANGLNVASTTKTITISDLGGSLNILRTFNEQYNPTLGHCSAKNAVFTGAFVWNSVLSQSDITNWQNNTSILPQSGNLTLELWFKDNKGNKVINNVDGSIGYVYDLKKWKGNFPFSNHHNTYQSISWDIGSSDYGIDFLASTTTDIHITVSNEHNCYVTDSIKITVEDSVYTNPNQANIYYQGGTPVNGGFVKLWKINSQGHKKLIGLFDIINGVVNFGELDAGVYALHLIGITGYKSFFYEDANNIQGADLIVLDNGNYIDLNIEIPVAPPNKNNQSKEVKEVTGTVSGYLSYAPTGKGKGIWKSGSPNKENPIPFEVVEVNLQSTSPLNTLDEITFYQTFMAGVSNETGYYEINNVPLGDYVVYPNISKYDSIIVDPYEVTITSTDTVFEDLNYEVDSVSGAGTGNGTTQVTDVINNDDIRIYPNPTNNYITIDLSSYKDAKIRIYNLMGMKIYENKIKKTNKTKINLSFAPRGVYLLQILTDNGTYSRKIMLE